ncbi:cell-cycle-associated protein kinase MAPK, putative [Toxoplasma gondii ME49]|uniref:Mitogen-activated protein kinase n=3 Tax=Toxoplasma gondii TaxID=5811 RepID=B6KP12_TOXGV|nr:cell-cycle-associated protein kinase MAPK, putative [Toxoplasma gondii ME49]EPT32431.1 cell-cycle-associated protein kinase MAPK, putative [Toxoplasma gondii ME49]ESS29375.1 putative cell-cycle-associated protein kinase MAPK [Toxoplasma gondii VEG]CEL71643.1 TPA: CMGC kinase, MAPK family [Toxoplasma gondii VEG]|eukprot:XP_002369585.1 cell-cycle-associated protein kinase MAPK, putative [Toxoplasma gondii ME49]
MNTGQRPATGAMMAPGGCQAYAPCGAEGHAAYQQQPGRSYSQQYDAQHQASVRGYTSQQVQYRNAHPSDVAATNAVQQQAAVQHHVGSQQSSSHEAAAAQQHNSGTQHTVSGSQQEGQQRKQHHSSKPTASMPRPHSDWQIPDRYEIRHLIGTGSYGHVCEAYDKLEKRVVAIKKILRVFEDLIDCKRILREIAILNRLNHDHVVKVLDIVIPKDVEKFDELYVVLEIADSDFKKLFRTPVYLTELHIKTLLYNLLVGVKYVHSAGILHRDLKPANCLVNQDCSVKVCDFGLARTVDYPENGNSQLPISPREDDMNLVTFPHTKNLKRQLTGHVVTRWYRAPELILLQENYTEAIDVWSIGCIFAELLNMIKENVAYHADRGPLFPGSSCFPLSPDQKAGNDFKFHTRGNRDQLNVIFNILGTPSEEDIEALEKEDAKRYIRIFPKREGTDLAERFPASSADAIHLLKRMLVFNPNKRITINECLAHPFFKEVRIAEVETNATEKVRLPFNDWMNMDEPQLRYAFVKEIQRYHPEIQLPRRSPNRASS